MKAIAIALNFALLLWLLFASASVIARGVATVPTLALLAAALYVLIVGFVHPFVVAVRALRRL